MPLLQIRDVPDEYRRRLKARAAERGQSLNTYLVELLTREATRPTVDQVLQRAQSRAEQLPVSSADTIGRLRAARESGEGSRRG